MLVNSKCEVLVSDVYSGYGKAVRIVNEQRQAKDHQGKILNAHCNAHARRYFFKSRLRYPEAEYFLKGYQTIYLLNSESKGKSGDEILRFREEMKVPFNSMKERAWEELPRYPHGNQYEKALRYFLNNYDGLTVFLKDSEVPIDNNAQERALRSPVVGRKTWYGTHSEQGAETAAILFSIVETCKLNDVNPREYLPALVRDLLSGKKPYTPHEFKRWKLDST